MACTAAACPCGAEAVIVTACPAGTSRSPFQGGLDRGHRLGRQRGQVRQRLVPDLAAVPVGAAHQH
jgi:hypothetical protein